MDSLETFARLDGGQFLEELAIEMTEVADKAIAKARKTGRPEKGSVTVKFDIVVASAADGTVIIAPSTKQSLPSREPGGNVFFSKDGEFHTRDPRQFEFDARVVDTSTGEIREVPQQAAVVREVSE